MKRHLVSTIVVFLFVACGTNTKKQAEAISVPYSYISYTDNVEGFHAAYTDNGHTLVYCKDSTGNYVAYYVKFDDNAGKHGYDRIKEKVIRAVLNAPLNNLISFSSISGGAFFEENAARTGCVFYFDEQMNDDSLEITELNQPVNSGLDSEVKDILWLLSVAHQIAHSISNKGASGWSNIAVALEPVQRIMDYDVITNNTIFSPKIKGHVSRIIETTEGLTQFHYMLEEEKNIKH